jgi:hypothetical protein
VSATATVLASDTPPAPTTVPVVTRRGGTGCALATVAQLDDGHLRIALSDGVEVVRPRTWVQRAGDGRDAIDVVLRPCGREVVVTWRDGRRARFEVAWLRGHAS